MPLLPERFSRLRARLDQRLGGFRGHVDGRHGEELLGWVQPQRLAQVSQPQASHSQGTKPAGGAEERARVGVFVQGARIAEASANIYRQDLDTAGIGDGRHGFAIPLTADLMRVVEANGGEVELRVLRGGQSAHLGRCRLCEAAENSDPLHGSALKKRLYSALELLSELRDAPPLPPIVRSPLGAHPARLMSQENASDPSRPLPAPMFAYTEFVRTRNRVDTQFDPNTRPEDAAHFFKFYLSAYAPMRRGLRVPLSAQAIDWLNAPVMIPGQPRHLSRVAWAFLMEVHPILHAMDFGNPDWHAWAVYWWAVNQAQAVGCEDCLVTEDMIGVLARVPDRFVGQDWPISEFMVRLHAETPEFAELSLESASARRDLTCAVMLLALTRPDYLRYIPEDTREAIFVPDPALAPRGGRRRLGRPPEEAPPAPLVRFMATLGAPQPGLTRDSYAHALRHRGMDLDTLAFDTFSAEGHRVEVARLPAPKALPAALPKHQRAPQTAAPEVDIQVIGPMRKASGLGQATRLSVAMLDRFARETGLTLNAVDYSLDNPAPEGFSTERDVADYRPARINLFHINAESLPLSVAYQPDVMQDAYNIGYFYWELDSPAPCHDLALDLLDEVWVSTEYGVSIYRPHTDKPVVNVGMSFEALPGIDRREARAFLDTHSGGSNAFTFLTTFDSFSFVQRKNPLGVLRAFQMAFPKDKPSNKHVRLVIKTQNRARVMDPVQMKIWEQVDEVLAGDNRIVLIDETLKYTDLLKLKKGADAYISLHRSEGWGFGMIEAMNLGVPVLATGYSGNMDFCDPDTCWLVDYTLTELRPDDYIFVRPGQKWAEPDVAHAARQMRAMRDNPEELACRAAAARAKVQREFSEDAIGLRYAARMEEILDLNTHQLSTDQKRAAHEA